MLMASESIRFKFIKMARLKLEAEISKVFYVIETGLPMAARMFRFGGYTTFRFSSHKTHHLHFSANVSNMAEKRTSSSASISPIT